MSTYRHMQVSLLSTKGDMAQNDSATACMLTDSERSKSLAGAQSSRDLEISISPSSIESSNSLKPKDVINIESIVISRSTKIIQIAIAVLNCFLSAGIVFGYAALKPILIEEQTYRNYCTREELDQNIRVCVQQEIRLNLMFTVAVVGTNVSALPVGIILDKYGPRICGLISSASLFIGALLFAFGADLKFDGYLIGYFFLAIGGAFTSMPYFHLSNTFPKNSGLILAMISGAFDSSSALFLIYKNIYFQSGKSLRPKKFFLIFLIVPVSVFLVQLFFMPKLSYKSIGEEKGVENSEQQTTKIQDDSNENTALLGAGLAKQNSLVTSESVNYLSLESARKQAIEEEKKKKISGIWGIMHGKTVKDQIFSSWFILLTLFIVLQMIRINYFIATVHPQYEYIFGSFKDADEINAVFDISLPIGGIVGIPFIGIILDNTSTLSVFSLILTVATTIGSLGCLPYKWAAYSNVILFVLFRPFFYTALSDSTAKIFGFTTFGTVYGLMISISGLCNFVTNGLDQLCYQIFHRNPIPINVFLLAATFVIGVVLCCFVKLKSNMIRNMINL
ncbi:putative major facilitator superfamily transporter protein [Erysiphe necator]|uniref:Putative major facilitator superfamily transporter protein n=1 Tax=Uncinula necator TaxID=52586 RepID=A0A0B1PE43_UNCNE|nr:putative major facilitator superfamily transporter protein [Erysiphe necator]